PLTCPSASARARSATRARARRRITMPSVVWTVCRYVFSQRGHRQTITFSASPIVKPPGRDGPIRTYQSVAVGSGAPRWDHAPYRGGGNALPRRLCYCRRVHMVGDRSARVSAVAVRSGLDGPLRGDVVVDTPDVEPVVDTLTAEHAGFPVTHVACL